MSVTFAEIDEAMERQEAVERLKEVLRWMLAQGHTQMPSSLDCWKQSIQEFYGAHEREWKDPILVPGPDGMIRVEPPRPTKEKARALTYVHVDPPSRKKGMSDDDFLDLMLASSDEEEEEEEEEGSKDVAC